MQMNGGSPMKYVNMSNAASSNSTTTKMDGIGGRNNGVDDADTDISLLDPAHLSIPTGLENTDFDFDSFFPHNSSTSSSESMTRTMRMNAANTSSSLAVTPLSAKPSVIDSTRDINFDIDGISGIGDINRYNVGHSPVSPPPESPVQSTMKLKTSSTPPTTTTRGSNTSGIGRKRKSEVIGMEELEDALLDVAKDRSGLVVPGGENVGIKAKRQKY